MTADGVRRTIVVPAGLDLELRERGPLEEALEPVDRGDERGDIVPLRSSVLPATEDDRRVLAAEAEGVRRAPTRRSRRRGFERRQVEGTGIAGSGSMEVERRRHDAVLERLDRGHGAIPPAAPSVCPIEDFVAVTLT